MYGVIVAALVAHREAVTLPPLGSEERIGSGPGLAVDRPAIIPTAARIGGQSRKAVPTESRVNRGLLLQQGVWPLRSNTDCLELR